MTIHRAINIVIAIAGIIAVVLLTTWILRELDFYLPNKPHPEPHKPDTIYKNIILKPDTVKIPEPPKTVTIYLPDTAFRKEKEKDTIVTDVKFDANTVTITKIDTKGVSYVSTFAIDNDIKSIHIDHRGHLQQKKRTKVGRFLRKAKWYAIGAVAVAGTIAIVILL